jgi:hypothetical protein
MKARPRPGIGPVTAKAVNASFWCKTRMVTCFDLWKVWAGGRYRNLDRHQTICIVRKVNAARCGWRGRGAGGCHRWAPSPAMLRRFRRAAPMGEMTRPHTAHLPPRAARRCDLLSRGAVARTPRRRRLAAPRRHPPSTTSWPASPGCAGHRHPNRTALRCTRCRPPGTPPACR